MAIATRPDAVEVEGLACAAYEVPTDAPESDGTLEWVVNQDINRGVGVRVGTDKAVYVLGQGQMLTVRYLQST